MIAAHYSISLKLASESRVNFDRFWNFKLQHEYARLSCCNFSGASRQPERSMIDSKIFSTTSTRCANSGQWIPKFIAFEGTKTMSELVRALEHENLLDRADKVPVKELRTGDTVRVHFRIVEGRNERVQVFQGTIIRKREAGPSTSITVRRTASHGVGVERTFPLYGPRLERVERVRGAHVRRANLYFLRERTGKRARLREQRHFKTAKKD